MEQGDETIRIRFQHIFWVLFVVAIVVAFIVNIVPCNNIVPISNEQAQPLNDGWVLERDNSAITLPRILPTKAGDEIVLTRAMPEYDSELPATLSFLTSMQTVRIEVDGQLVYDYGNVPNGHLELPLAPAWHVVRLPYSVAGKQLRITYSSPFNRYGGVLNPIELGTKYANVTTLFFARLFSITLSFILFLMGLVAILICFLTRKKASNLHKLLYLGTASVLIAVWSACETKVMQVFTENVHLIMFATFLSIMLIPIALLLFFRENFMGRIRKGYNVFLGIFCLYFLVVVGLQVANVMSIAKPFSVFLVLSVMALLLMLVSSMYAYQKEKTQQTRLTAIALFYLVAFCMVDLVRFASHLGLTGYHDTTMFSRIGMLAMLCTLGYSSVRQLLTVYSDASKAQVYKELSETDALTGLKNRLYLTDVYPELFQQAIKKKKHFSVIMIDIDNFKKYNDNYGHSAGDEVICSVAGVFLAIGDNSLCGAVRYGGEEFLILLPFTTPNEAVATAETIKVKVTELAIPHEHSAVAPIVSLSQGIYSAVPVPGETLESFIASADEVLYCMKGQGKNGYTLQSK